MEKIGAPFICLGRYFLRIDDLISIVFNFFTSSTIIHDAMSLFFNL